MAQRGRHVLLCQPRYENEASPYRQMRVEWFCQVRVINLRLWLRRVVAEGDGIARNIVETLHAKGVAIGEQARSRVPKKQRKFCSPTVG